MQQRILTGLFCFLVMGLCLATSVAWAGKTAHYVGRSLTARASTPTKYLRTVQFLVKREVLPKRGHIIETIYQQGQVHQTILRRVGKTNVFVASDAKKTFVGTVEYKGNRAWHWKQWNYRIVLRGSGLLMLGSGRLDAKGMKTQKRLYTTTAAPLFLVKENLRSITAMQFRRMLAAIVTKTKAKPKPSVRRAAGRQPKASAGTGGLRAFPVLVSSLTTTKKPLSKAIVRIGNKIVGLTNRQGVFRGVIHGRKGQSVTIRVIGRGANNFVNVRETLQVVRSAGGAPMTKTVRVTVFLKAWK